MRNRRACYTDWRYAFFQPNACNYCDDISAETADIVFGDE
ncbi:Coenzyme F420 hydrogenase/dehydrogenase, beta subunit C-terminal domain [Alteromonas mediterranea]